MKILPLLLLLPIGAVPAAAQSRVYTNADLSAHPVTTWTRTVTSAELESLRAHQFVSVPPAREPGPSIYVMASSATEGPFGAFTPLSAPRRLDGTAYTDPQWVQVAYVGRSYGSGFSRAAHARPSTDSSRSQRAGAMLPSRHR